VLKRHLKYIVSQWRRLVMMKVGLSSKAINGENRRHFMLCSRRGIVGRRERVLGSTFAAARERSNYIK